MPVAIRFIETTLEQCLGHSVEIHWLFEFLKDVVVDPSRKQALLDFIKKWTSCLLHNSKTMNLVTYRGIWPPKTCTELELRRQPSWEEFARRYDSTFTECDIDSQTSPEYQPLNFMELLRISFWKEMYEQFGNQIVTHIFEKCALIYEVDEGLYLIVGCPRGTIYKKISKFDERTNKKVAKPSNQLISKHGNPYQMKLENCEEEIVEQKKSDSPVFDRPHEFQRKRASMKRPRIIPNDDDRYEVVNMPERKILKIEASTSRNTNDKTSADANRWICPKPEVLQKIINLRNSTLKACDLQASNITTSNAMLNYLKIQKDDTFKPKDKSFIMKQKIKLPVAMANHKLPHDWQGLKLPDDLNSIADTEGNICINVYIISETLAKKLEIRIKPKGRQIKRNAASHRAQVMDSSSSNGILCEEDLCQQKPSHSKTKTPTLSEGRLYNVQNTTSNDSQIYKAEAYIHCKQPMDQDKYPQLVNFSAVEPYSLTVTLPIAYCLYNKSSWSKWPTYHCLINAGRALPSENVTSIRLLVDDVLKEQTCSEAANQYLINSIKLNWILSDTSNPLNKIILDIIQAHLKFKDVHKLFKNCVSYWRLKCFQKIDKKRNHKLPSADSSHRFPIVSGRNYKLNKSNRMEEPEIIDLAQSTSSTHYTISDQENPQIMESMNRSPTVSGPSSPILPENDGNILQGNLLTASKVSKRTKYRLLHKCSGTTMKKKSFESLKYPVPHNCVMQSLKQIFFLTKVDRFLGSKRNVRGFFKFVRKALILGGTKSSLHLSELMALIHPGDFPINHVTNNELAWEIFAAKLVTWLFNKYVLVLLKNSFYITECNFSRMQLKFYLRESWISASYKMKNHLVEKGALNGLDEDQHQQPNAALRYVPKKNNSLRSLLLTKKSRWSLNKEDNRQLNMYLHFIDAKINKSRMFLPTTIQQEWRRFYSEWKKSGSPKLYYLRMDIQDAYPSVSLKTMSDILKNSGSEREQEMIVKKYALIGSSCVKRIRENIFDGMDRDNWHYGIHVRPCIVMDLGKDTKVNLWKMLNYITSIMANKNVVRVGKKSYQFHYGLPQGWSQSPILCNIYYGFIDASLYLPYIKSHGRLFLRVVDDYLVVTPKASEISNLIQLMKIGCEKYGIKLNEEKSKSNIFVRSDEEMSNSHCEQVKFCGWNFCMTCGHVSRDFKKYIGQDFCSTITFSMPSNVISPEQFLRLRGTLIVPARVTPILIDPAINCYKRILLTVFEASIMLGFRFYAICRVVYPNLNALKEVERVNAVVSCIHLCCIRLAKFVSRNAEYRGPSFSSQEKARCVDNCCGTHHTSEVYSVSEAGILSIDSLQFASLYGFRLKLLRHSGVFDKVIPKLNRSMSKIRKNIGDKLCDSIISIAGPEIPKCFSKIRI